MNQKIQGVIGAFLMPLDTFFIKNIAFRRNIFFETMTARQRFYISYKMLNLNILKINFADGFHTDNHSTNPQ